MGPDEYTPEKKIEKPLLDILKILSSPKSILFVAKPGDHGALMQKGFHCQKVPNLWIRRLVSGAHIDQKPAGQSTVAVMGWIEYEITYEGQQALNRRYD